MPDTGHLNSEARIVQQAIQGDKQAFGQLYEMYADRIFRYLFFRTSSEVVAEDLMCEVFFKAWSALPKFNLDKKHNNFKAWLYKIAHNTLIDHRRTLKTEIPIDQLVELQSVSEKPEKRIEDKEEILHLLANLNTLDDLSRQVLIHRFVAGLSHRETAALLGIREAHVRVIQFRAIKKMREISGDGYEEK